MTKFAVIIVNYNVAFFLEQCLHSVVKASEGIDAEIWVVDNDSKDGSVDMVREKFPKVRLIANKENLGFSKANNQAIIDSNSEYVLLLNPDTVVEEDTFSKVIDFMDAHSDAGGLGVKMIDGKGDFLPESKRGLPTPTVAFYKIIGLSKLFPKSRKFGKYHLGFLDKEKTHEVDVLSGAFMMLRRSVLGKIGLLDEAFFMYGEDIDMSYRISLGGYKNYYLPSTSIIHYKGESTKKSSVNYVFVFYRAMVIFAKKHFSNKNATLFSHLINIAIWLRAGVAIGSRFVKALVMPAVDFTMLFGSLVLIKNGYGKYSGINYENTKYLFAFIAYVSIWVIAMYMKNAYDKPYRVKKNFLGLAYGTALILILYSLLPEDLRFSRALILLGALGSFIIVFLSRLLYTLLFDEHTLIGPSKRNHLVVGQNSEIERVRGMLSQAGLGTSTIRSLVIDNNSANKRSILSTLSDYIAFNNIQEVIFCAKDVSSQEIIQQMSSITSEKVNFKIAPPESLFIIGSNSSNESGDFLTFDINAISKRENIRNKRLFDFVASLVMLIFSPILIFLVKNKASLFPKIFTVLFGKKTWVSYDRSDEKYIVLPKIKSGIIHPTIVGEKQSKDPSYVEKSNIIYAKDYSVFNDVKIVLKKLSVI